MIEPSHKDVEAVNQRAISNCAYRSGMTPTTANKCFEFFLTNALTRSETMVFGERISMAIHPDAEGSVDAFLERYVTNVTLLFWRLDVSCQQINRWPWAIILFESEMRVAGHLLSIRKEKSDFSFSAHSIRSSHYSIEKSGPPPVSFILMNSKAALKESAPKSELLTDAWNQLGALDEDRRWICIAGNPSHEWLVKTAGIDDALFMKLKSSSAGRDL